MRSMRLLLAPALVAAAGACYHATVETGATPSNVTVEKAWASGWIYGLVPPSTVETASKCPNGAARIETQVSFANQLVNFLTLGIYSPMEIKVTLRGRAVRARRGSFGRSREGCRDGGGGGGTGGGAVEGTEGGRAGAVLNSERARPVFRGALPPYGTLLAVSWTAASPRSA